jgi:hypothetical protein
MYDIVFISYNEPNAEENWQRLSSRFPLAKRVHGVKGIHQAHIVAAKKCFTNMIWVVDGDAVILDSFDFSYKTKLLDTVHVWRSSNPINDLEYGNGGVKLLPRHMTINMNITKPDMTTSISTKFKPVLEISNITAFNSDPFNTWKSAFRECVKLSSRIIDRQVTDETSKRLDVWCTKGIDRTFGNYAINGAIAGSKYGIQYKYDISALKKINDFDWLASEFKNYE